MVTKMGFTIRISQRHGGIQNLLCSLLWVSGPFHVFWITVGCRSVGYSVKDCSFALPPGSQSVQLPNFVTEKDTERNLILGLQHWCHSRREFRCPVQHAKNGPELSWVLCAHVHFIASPFTFSAGLSPLSGITGILGGGGILCIVRSPGKFLFVSCSSSYEPGC